MIIMIYAVRCPICQVVIKIYKKPKYFFQHCGMSHNFEQYLVTFTENPKKKAVKIGKIKEEELFPE